MATAVAVTCIGGRVRAVVSRLVLSAGGRWAERAVAERTEAEKTKVESVRILRYCIGIINI